MTAPHAPKFSLGAGAIRSIRLTLSRNELAAGLTEGWPTDQFALDEKPSHLWALVNRPSLGCGDVGKYNHDYELPPLARIRFRPMNSVDSPSISIHPRISKCPA